MNKILIKNATIVNEDKIFESDLLIVNDIISQIDKNISKSNDYKVIDASGKILIPFKIAGLKEGDKESPAEDTV